MNVQQWGSRKKLKSSNYVEDKCLTVARLSTENLSTTKSICAKPQTAVIYWIIDEVLFVRPFKLVVLSQSKLELPSAGIHLMALQDPLVLPKL